MEWKPVLEDHQFKNIITDSLRFLSNENRVAVYGFVIMNNHFHLIWQIKGDHTREDVQRDFLKYTRHNKGGEFNKARSSKRLEINPVALMQPFPQSQSIERKSITMKKILSLIAAILLVSSASIAQKRETRDVSTFTKISFRSPGKVYVKQGSPQKVEIEGSAEVLEKIKTNVEDGKLSIGSDEKWSNWSWGDDDDKVTVYITVANIEALSVSGSGDLIAQTKITSNNLKLNVSGSGSLEAEIDAADVDADVSGSGDMDLKGKCKSFSTDISGSGSVTLNAVIAGAADFDISGSGKVEATGSSQSVKAEITGSGKVLAANLVTDKCEVRISGSGDVEINVKTELDAHISGSGTVSYRGNPSRVNADSSGSGKVRKM